MAVMTAKGKTLRVDCGSEVAFMPGDRVQLKPLDLTGVVHSWTDRGVMVLLDVGCRPYWAFGLVIAALDCGDYDIVRKIN